MRHNVTTGIGVSHGRGVILLAIEQYGAPLFSIRPIRSSRQWLATAAPEKRQVMDMTRRILKMEKVARPDDAADAITIALCHAKRYEPSEPRAGGKGDSVCFII